MALTKTAVTGPILDGEGEAYDNARVRFTPRMAYGDDSADTIIAQTPVFVTPTDGTGAFSVDLVASGDVTYDVALVQSLPDSTKAYRIGPIKVPDTGPVALQDLLPIYDPALPTNEELLTALSAAVSDAEIAAEASGDAAELAQAWAESDTPPAGAGTKSSKTYAGESKESAIEAALYDGPKVDTFSDLADVTSDMLEVGGFIRCIELNETYQRVSSGGHLDYTGSGGVMLKLSSNHTGWHNIKALGAVLDGVTDETSILLSARSLGKVWIPDGTLLVDSFDSTTDDGFDCAILLTDDIEIAGTGAITATVGVTSCIFAADATSGEIVVSLKGIKFSGPARHRAVHVSEDAVLKSMQVSGVTTSKQSMVFNGQYTKSFDVTGNYIGADIEAADAISPFLSVVLVEGSAYRPTVRIDENTVTTGTESLETIIVHYLPAGSSVQKNNIFNIGGGSQGYDLDNLGEFTRVIGNYAYKTDFEYKCGTAGYSANRDVIFSQNISYKGTAAYSMRSSCIGSDNIAYAPTSYGLFMDGLTDVDNLLDDANISLAGFKIIYAGGTWTAAVKIGAGAKSITVENLHIEIDPAWRAANLGSKMPARQILIAGDQDNITFRNLFVDDSVGDQINFRPDTTASGLVLDNVRFGDCDDSCVDLANCENVRIINPEFPTTIGDRPVRLSACDRVRIDGAPFNASLVLAQTSGGNTGVLINNWGQEAAGTGVPPDASSRWPLGCMVTNTSDDTVWLRDTGSSAPTSAWKQLA